MLSYVRAVYLSSARGCYLPYAKVLHMRASSSRLSCVTVHAYVGVISILRDSAILREGAMFVSMLFLSIVRVLPYAVFSSARVLYNRAYVSLQSHVRVQTT